MNIIKIIKRFFNNNPKVRNNICKCGHEIEYHRFIGKIQSCEYGLDDFKDECCLCFNYRPISNV